MDAVGRVSNAGTKMAMLALPSEDAVTLDLVERNDAGPLGASGLDYLAIQVDDLEVARHRLLADGLDPGEIDRPGAPTVRER